MSTCRRHHHCTQAPSHTHTPHICTPPGPQLCEHPALLPATSGQAPPAPSVSSAWTHTHTLARIHARVRPMGHTKGRLTLHHTHTGNNCDGATAPVRAASTQSMSSSSDEASICSRAPAKVAGGRPDQRGTGTRCVRPQPAIPSTSARALAPTASARPARAAASRGLQPVPHRSIASKQQTSTGSHHASSRTRHSGETSPSRAAAHGARRLLGRPFARARLGSSTTAAEQTAARSAASIHGRQVHSLPQGPARP